MTGLVTIALKYEQDVVSVRQRARQIAARLGFDSQDQVRIATSVSEIARNAFAYAGGGTVEFSIEPQRPVQALSIHIVDRGPGIADLNAVLTGAYRSSTGMGLGILGAQRLMDECQIRSGPGEGTQVVLAKYLPRSAPRATAASLARLIDELISKPPDTAYDEVLQQNQELLRTVEEVRQRQDELTRLNRELEDTNRGVVALYAELDEKAESLRRADESKTRFLSNMGHEFRTPLNSIRGLTRLLLDHIDGPLSAEQEKQVRFIRKAAEDLTTMVDDLLDLAKIEAGRLEARPVAFSVDDLFSTLRGMLKPLLVSESVHLVFEESDYTRPLFTDEGKLSQILRNFISNALKFTEHGEVRVRADLQETEQQMRFSVADTGIGIAPEDQERIFEEFTQLGNHLQARSKGTGLGLPLCRRLATLLNGRVDVESAAGLGSTFSVTIPLHYRAAGAANQSVLIIDDEEPARYFLTKLLAEHAVEVHQAYDGTTGVHSARRLRPGLIFLDIRMPDKNGAEVLAELKADPATAGIPVVMVSSLTLNTRDQRDFEEAAAVLRKEELSPEVVRGILAKASLVGSKAI